MEHLSLEIFDREKTGNEYGSQYAWLPENASITISDTSEIFASGDVWSHSFQLNVRANAHLFGSSGEIHGALLHEQLHNRRARLWVEGVPLYFGYIRLSDEVDVDKDGNVDVTFESGKKTFEKLIEGAKANQVPPAEDVLIGMAQWRKRWIKLRVKMTASVTYRGKDTKFVWPGQNTGNINNGEDIVFEIDGENENTSVQQYPRFVLPRGTFINDVTGEEETIDCINTDIPYDEAHPYCNTTLCYQRSGYEKQMDNGQLVPDYSSEPEAQRGYEAMPADRVNAAPNFYVIYWLKSLMKHLGIHIEENQMLDVEDMRRLFFVNTQCAHEEPKYLRTHEGPGGTPYNERLGRYRVVPDTQQQIRRIISEQFDFSSFADTDNSAFKAEGYPGSWVDNEPLEADEEMEINSVTIGVKSISDLTGEEKEEYNRKNQYLHKAYATSECFPNTNISEVIQALESGFGIRFLFDNNYERVRIILLRNIFRSEEVQRLECDIIDEVKVENNIRGFKLTYGNTEDTHFFYKGFDDMLPHQKTLWPDTSDKHDYSFWDLDAVYKDLINRISAFDKTCFVTPLTGNAYGIKIDKDAKRYNDLHPSLFEYAGFMDAEDGDCSGEEDTIKTVNIGFTPLIVNDLNFEAERDAARKEGGDPQTDPGQQFAMFVDEKMRPRRYQFPGYPCNDPTRIYDPAWLYADNASLAMRGENGIVKPGEFFIHSDAFAAREGLWADIPMSLSAGISLPVYIRNLSIDGYVSAGYRLYLQDNYEPNDDGVSPIETHDWGLTMGIMRGSGKDAFISYTPDPDDGEGNDTWDVVPGNNVSAHSDTCNNYGEQWQYAGEQTLANNTQAHTALPTLFPASNAAFWSHNANRDGYITGASLHHVMIAGEKVPVLYVTTYSSSGRTINSDEVQAYFDSLSGATAEEVYRADAQTGSGRNIIVEVGSTMERASTLLQVSDLAYGTRTSPIVISNGVSTLCGRLSLKLRAAKPNPRFNPQLPESETNRRYLQISDESLRSRGLLDTLYKEYSYWSINARIVKRTVRMTLAQFLSIDKTVRVSIGDVTGFIRKMQFTVSNDKGLGLVTMEVMYI